MREKVEKVGRGKGAWRSQCSTETPKGRQKSGMLEGRGNSGKSDSGYLQGTGDGGLFNPMIMGTCHAN